VFELGNQLRFTPETLNEATIRAHRRGENLKGNFRLRAGVDGEIDRRHASLADPLDYPIMI
jgi:hypothetical protein